MSTGASVAKPLRVATFLCWVCAFWFFVASPLSAFQLPNGGQQNVLPPPCATDPDYREFEKVQADAYLTEKALDFRIVLNPDFQSDVAQKTINALRIRSHQRSTALPVTPEFVRDLRTELKQIKTPTCYENPVYYFMMSHLANEVELARRELGLPLAELPKFGSLPSNDINAYTYLTRHGRGRIIAINAQLFHFINAMTRLAASGVDPTMHPKKDSLAEIIAESLLDISYNQQAKDTFVRSILGLLLGNSIPKTPVNSSREYLVIFFDGAVGRFVFAHEYAHVIKRHASPPMLLPTGTKGNEEHEVLAWEWKQEFDADAIGVQLLIQLLQAEAADNPNARPYYIYAMKAPLFFFECMELLDQASFMLENRTTPPILNDADKALVRSCADRTMPEAKSSCSIDVLGSHPPSWLRRERLEKYINDRLAHLPNHERAEVAAQKGDEMIFSIDLFWKETSHQLLEQILKQADGN